MTSPWGLIFLLIVPGLLGLVVFMNWLEVYLTCQLVADDIAVAWQSIDSADELEQKVGRIVERVVASSR